MRRLGPLLILLLILAACETTTDDSDDVEQPTPTAVVDEEPPEPTPTPTAEPTPEPTPTPEPEEGIGPELQAFLDEVIENVVELRGLELLEDLEFALMTREELAEMLEEEIELEQADIDMYWILRLLDDREIDLGPLMIEAQAADIYGFYDVETRETFLIADDEELSAMEEVILAHEITHALQDQHFGLELLLEEDGDYDRMTAFLAMVEGDAVLTQEFYAQRYLDADRRSEYQQGVLAALQDSDATDAIEALPHYIIESLSFPYVAGPMFMLQAFDGDLNSMDEFLINPPASTLQVLNPAAYLRGDIPDPVEVELPDMLDNLGDDWELHDTGSFGVFDLTVMFEVNGVDDPDSVLEWWDGGSFAVYISGDNVVGMIGTQWDDEERAADYEALLIETMAEYVEEDGIWMGDGRFHTIIVENNLVTLKSASDEEALLSMIQ
jgi:hypothetical protein